MIGVMTRALVAIGALLALFFVVLGIVVFTTREKERVTAHNLLSEDLTRAIQLSDGQVDLLTVADFPWDRVLVIAPGAPREAVSAALGSDYDGVLPFGSRDQVFVFARGSAVARIADYRGRGTFSGLEQPVDELARDRAVLRVNDLVVSPGA
jgi:hypothetical protein